MPVGTPVFVRQQNSELARLKIEPNPGHFSDSGVQVIPQQRPAVIVHLQKQSHTKSHTHHTWALDRSGASRYDGDIEGGKSGVSGQSMDL